MLVKYIKSSEKKVFFKLKNIYSFDIIILTRSAL